VASHIIPWTVEIWKCFWEEIINAFEKEANLDMLQRLHAMKQQFEMEVDKDALDKILKK